MNNLIIAIGLVMASTIFAYSDSNQKSEQFIISQVNKLFEGADERNWEKIIAVMDKQVLIDYSSMNGSPATIMTPEQITSAWSAFLPGFDRTNHKLTNFKVIIKNDTAVVSYDGTADHFLNSKVWTVIGSYKTVLKSLGDIWLVYEHHFDFKKQNGDLNLPKEAATKMGYIEIREKNRNVVENFFVALETQKFEKLKEVFAENGKQLNPYSPEGFPKSFDGSEAIYKQYNGLKSNFGIMKFPRQIFATEDPNFFFVKFKGVIEIKTGGMYENDYLGTFRLENGKVVEYTEYFNQIIMAKAFGIQLK